MTTHPGLCNAYPRNFIPLATPAPVQQRARHECPPSAPRTGRATFGFLERVRLGDFGTIDETAHDAGLRCLPSTSMWVSSDVRPLPARCFLMTPCRRLLTRPPSSSPMRSSCKAYRWFVRLFVGLAPSASASLDLGVHVSRDTTVTS